MKCSLIHPCTPCQEANLQCTFLSTRLKKGRKGETANVLNELRTSQSRSQTAPLNPFPFHGLSYTSPTFSLDVQTSPRSLDILPARGRFLRTPDLLPSPLIGLCAELFFTQLGSTVPILTPESVRHAAATAAARNVEAGEEAGEEAYCFTCAFCAFVILQTGGPDRSLMPLVDANQSASSYGQLLLREALSARSHLDLLVLPTLQTVVLTFFIYGCHSALGKHRKAWYYLREATTLYTSATMDCGDEVLDDTFSRLFWLLLISERFVCHIFVCGYC